MHCDIIKAHKSASILPGMQKVDKRIANIAPIFKVHAKVHKIIHLWMTFVDKVNEHGLSILVGDVSQHASRSPIQIHLYFPRDNFIGYNARI